MFSAYPTKHSRIGNAVGLDTPASAIALLKALRDNGYHIGEVPGLAASDGDALMHALIERGGQDPDWLTQGQLAGNPIRIPAVRYRQWFAALPAELAESVVAHWGPSGELYVDRSADPDGEIVVAAMTSGNLVILVQPPRGFGANPVAIYHDPDLPPSHHYLATICGCATSSVRTRWSTWASTATSNGCPARHSGSRRTALPMPPSVIFRWSTRSWSTIPGGHPGQAPGARRSGGPPDSADGAGGDLRRHRPP